MKINVIPRGVMASILMLAVISLIYYSTAALAERGGNGNGKNKGKGAIITQSLVPVACGDIVPLDKTDTIWVGLEERQCFAFEIAISGAKTDDVFVDSIGAVWDLRELSASPQYLVKSGDCDVTLTQPASSLNTNNLPEQEPEHITIVMGVETDGVAACKVDIYVGTEKKRNSDTFHPGGCDYLSEDSNMDGVTNPGLDPSFDDSPLLDGSGVPMVDWVALNDGAKGYAVSNGILMSARGHSYQLQPLGCDFDGDGLSDALEILLGTNPLIADGGSSDFDGDGLFDGEEVNTYGTDPLIADTDGDGVWDGIEVNNGTNPNDNSDF